MGAGSRQSVALVLLVTLMMVATSHCTMSNKSSTGGDVASAGWCNGSTVDGQCLLIAASYWSDHVDLNMQDDHFDMMVEYDSGESARRVLASGGTPPLDVRKATSPGLICLNQEGQRYTCHQANNGKVPPCPNKATYNRNCVLPS